jgi:hypothetical protein
MARMVKKQKKVLDAGVQNVGDWCPECLRSEKSYES